MSILYLIIPGLLFVGGLFGKLWLKNRQIAKLETKVEHEVNRADTAEAKGAADSQVDAKTKAGLEAEAKRMEDPTVAGKKGKDKIRAIDIATRKKKMTLMLLIIAVIPFIACHTPPPKTIVVTPKSCLAGLGPRPMPPPAAEPCDDEWADYYEREQAWVDAIEIACK